jgi:hypothetical protein
MSIRQLWVPSLGCFLAGLVVWAFVAHRAYGQSPAGGPRESKPTSAPAAVKTPELRIKVPTPQTVTLTGRVVDIHGFMTGSYPSEDRAKCTADCIKAGVPAGLETAGGLILLGTGPKGAADRLVPLAYQVADVKGKLYLKQGARYLEITSISKSTKSPEEQGPAAKGSTGDAARRTSVPK